MLYDAPYEAAHDEAMLFMWESDPRYAAACSFVPHRVVFLYQTMAESQMEHMLANSATTV